MKFRITKNKIIVGIIIIGILLGTFWFGGNSPDLQRWRISDTSTKKNQDLLIDVSKDIESDGENIIDDGLKNQEKKVLEDEGNAEPILEGIEGLKEDSSNNKNLPTEKEKSEGKAEVKDMNLDPETGKDKYQTNPVPKGQPIPVEPEDTKVTDLEGNCTISIRCDNILENMEWLNPEKIELVPEDGVILASKSVEFFQGESVFDVLKRETRNEKIHMEFINTPIYNSAYIEGINNLYEFDCGELSGWMYRVNNWVPNYGSSRYQVKEGDKIEWIYTCDLGKDAGRQQQ